MTLPPWQGKTVIVVGDLMLDRFVYGRVSRISPEAPIPVVEVTRETAMPGGAANVAHNVAALGGRAVLLGVVGDDERGAVLVREIERLGIDAAGVVAVPGRTTTVKTRIIAQHQQVVRVDREETGPVPEAVRGALLKSIEAEASKGGALVVSDYTKGVLTPGFLCALGEAARRSGLPYVVDPKPAHFPYPGATVVTPNRDETQGFHGGTFSLEELPAVAGELLGRTDWGAILFTLGADGMALARRGEPIERIPARVREVYDVTGAGDTVVAVVSLALAAGTGLPEAARLANLAAGVAVGKVGTSPCLPGELAAALAEHGHGL